MTYTTRIFLALLILAIDILLFFIPLTAFFLVYILLFNPPWFRILLTNMSRQDDNLEK